MWRASAVPRTNSRYYPADYEPATFDFVKAHCKPGSTVLDIGAHMGLFSVVMARGVGGTGRVFSFEPTPHVRQILEDVIKSMAVSQWLKCDRRRLPASADYAIFHGTGNPCSNRNSLVDTRFSKSTLSVSTISINDFAAANNLSVQ